MSDKVASVVAIAPVAAPGRGNPFVQAGSGSSNQNPKNQPQEAGPQAPVRRQDLVSLQSLEVEQAQSTPVRPPTQSVSQAESQAALQAAEATAQAQAEEQSRQQNQSSLHDVANTLSSYFSDVHPDVNFRVEQQASGMV